MRRARWKTDFRPLRSRQNGGSAPRFAPPGNILGQKKAVLACGGMAPAGRLFHRGLSYTNCKKVAGPPVGEVSSPSTGIPCTLGVIFGGLGGLLELPIRRGATFVDLGNVRLRC